MEAMTVLGMIGFGAGTMSGSPLLIKIDQVHVGSGTEESWLALGENETAEYSISDRTTLTLKNYSYVGKYYPDDAVGPLPEVEFGGGALHLALGSRFAASPATTDGTGTMLFLDNLSRSDSGSGAAYGGAVFGRTSSVLEIANGWFIGNTARGAEGCDGSGKGGAIYSQGTVTLSNSDFLGNVAGDAEIGPGMGGAFFGDFACIATVEGCGFSGNVAIGGRDSLSAGGGGAAVFNRGELVVRNSSFTENEMRDGDEGETSFGGGAIANQGGVLTATDVDFVQNHSIADGGAILSSTITDSDITYEGKVTVSRCTFSGNTAAGAGGAIGNGNGQLLTVTDATFSGNSAGAAGALFSANSLIENCTFTENVANKLLSNIVKLGMGGAIMTSAAEEPGSKTTILNSSFKGNSSNYCGGALFNTSGIVEMTGGEFTENTAGLGAAIYSLGGSITLTDVVFTGNTGTATTTLKSHGGGAVGLSEDAKIRFVVSSGKSLSYTGNSARGTAAVGAHDAAAGGFLFLKTNGGKSPSATFDIGEGATLTIGSANATDSAIDSIASNDSASLVTKTGVGKLVLNADNSGFRGTLDIAEGQLVLAGEKARLGGAIRVRNVAILSVSGSLTAGTGKVTSIELCGSSLLLAGGGLITEDDGAIRLSSGFLALPGEHAVADLLAETNLLVNDGAKWNEASEAELKAIYIDGTSTRYEDTFLFGIFGDSVDLNGYTVIGNSAFNLAWSGFTLCEENWFGGAWYGVYYYDPIYGNYFWHSVHGWQYFYSESTADAVYLWDYGTASWWYTDRKSYPWVFQYRFDGEQDGVSGTWYRYERGATPDRVFLDWETQKDLGEGQIAQ